MISLYTCDSYFELFKTLIERLKNGSDNLDKRTLIFCEAKISLMVERYICASFGGTFNTRVCSFGQYVLEKKTLPSLLSKEGSAMVIKRILSQVPLKCLKNNKSNLSSSLYDLMILLKSAKISPEQIEESARNIEKSILKSKLSDISLIFREYEKFLVDACADDQSSVLSHLVNVIENDRELAETDVILLGYSGFTAQLRAGIESLSLKAKSLTAILTDGSNRQVFVGETPEFIRGLAKEKNLAFIEKNITSNYSPEGKKIVENLFSPFTSSQAMINSNERVYLYSAKNPLIEVERVGEIIKKKVLSGECRYKDITLAIPEQSGYGELIESVFSALEIPVFLDEKKDVSNHPLVTLITSYLDAKRRNYERKTLSTFYKNPLFESDKSISDEFENYCLKYNINFNKILMPFDLHSDKERLVKLNEFRQKIVEAFSEFNILQMLKLLKVDDKLENLSSRLKTLGQIEQSSINEQMFSAVMNILDQIGVYLAGVNMTIAEYKSVFLSGINALKLSIIPQYNDAVFVGDYKQTALAKAKYLFALGLTESLPSVQQDVALLSDGDIDLLEQIKIKIEPKTNIINHRIRENFALALSAFSDGLFLSYPIAGIDGKAKGKSDVLVTIEKLFNCRKFLEGDKYLTNKQGKKNFAFDVGSFADRKEGDISYASAFYEAVNGEGLKDILTYANKDMKTKLNLEGGSINISEVSPTFIEGYFDCPYKAFLTRILRLTEREEGDVDAPSAGTLIHEILCEYGRRIEEVNDKEQSDALFESIKESVIKKEEYSKYLKDSVQGATVSRIFNECKQYCYKTFLSIQNSSFKIRHTEVGFGSDKNSRYPAISLCGGKIKLKGKIDRIDECQNFYRVIDYKSGGFDYSEEGLFYGNKLQLYLYGEAVKNGAKDKKDIAGVYYLPIDNSFEAEKKKCLAYGITSDNEEAILAQDKNILDNKKSEFVPVTIQKSGTKNALSEQEMSAYFDYAIKVSELAAERISSGFIAQSPIEDGCKYCQFKGICDSASIKERQRLEVDKTTIIDAVKGGEEDATD